MPGEFTNEWNDLSERAVQKRHAEAVELKPIHDSTEGDQPVQEVPDSSLDPISSDVDGVSDYPLPDDPTSHQEINDTAEDKNATRIIDRRQGLAEPEPLSEDEWKKLIRRGTGRGQPENARTLRKSQLPSPWLLVTALGLLALIGASFIVFYSLR